MAPNLVSVSRRTPARKRKKSQSRKGAHRSASDAATLAMPSGNGVHHAAANGKVHAHSHAHARSHSHSPPPHAAGANGGALGLDLEARLAQIDPLLVPNQQVWRLTSDESKLTPYGQLCELAMAYEGGAEKANGVAWRVCAPFAPLTNGARLRSAQATHRARPGEQGRGRGAGRHSAWPRW
jgi:uncharacterized protein (UPF0261 family)